MSLDHKRNATIRTLSGGMKRRLAFVRALLSDPEMLILDEPTTGLDPTVRHLLWEKVLYFRQAGKTTLVTTHYMHEAELLCDRIVILNRGVVVGTGAPRELIAREAPGYVGLFVSYRADLLPFGRVLSAHRSAFSRRAGAVLTVLSWCALAPNGGVGARVSRGGRGSRGASVPFRGRPGWMGIQGSGKNLRLSAFSPIDLLSCIPPSDASASTRWKANRNLILLSTTNQKGALRSRSARRWRLPNIVWKEIKWSSHILRFPGNFEAGELPKNLFSAGFDVASKKRLRIVPLCSYAARVLQEHPEFHGLPEKQRG